MRITLVDPSLFTAPYNAGLHSGISARGHDAVWAVRPLRPGERGELPNDVAIPSFYRSVDNARWLPARLRGPAKGLSHVTGLLRLLRDTRIRRPKVVHFQWTMVPILDWAAIVALKWMGVRVVLTVHDANPFNGEKMTLLQKLGFHLPIRAADRLIVHTQAARRKIFGHGIADRKIAVVAHGPLRAPELAADAVPPARDGRVTFVMFGLIKTYKGVDVMIEAVGRLAPEVRARVHVVVAGKAQMDMAPLIARCEELGIQDAIEFRIGRLSENEMALLFSETDVFLLPYRVIDASGVYYMVRPLGRWIIASRVGVFAEDFIEDEDGRLVPPGDVEALSAAMAEAVAAPPRLANVARGGNWEDIGRATERVYEDAIAA